MGEGWGGATMVPVAGAYGGGNGSDLGVYDLTTGGWYIRGVSGGLIGWGLEWGGWGYAGVMGDYDGDGQWDLCVYDWVNGQWYIRSVSGALLMWGEGWGGYGYRPVAGDYDGDGIWDLCVYDEANGLWYARKVSGFDRLTAGGEVILWGVKWGAAGYTPVSGDYDGGGRYDLAVYHEGSGLWYIWSPVNGTILLNNKWGEPGYLPVGR